MPVDAFRLKNFMAFQDTGWITLRRINLLLGRNSSGKTAIIRALRLMKQSLLDQSTQQALKFKAEGGVDIGSFQVALHKPTNPILEADQITFGIRGWINAQSLDDAQNSDKDIKWAILRKYLSGVADTKAITLPFEVQLSYKRTGLVYFQVNLIESEFSRRTEIFSFQLDSRSSDFTHQAFRFDADEAQKNFTLSSNTSFLPDIIDAEFVDQLHYRLQERVDGLILFWNACKKEIESFLSSIHYIGPIRPQPERYYAITDEMEREWSLRGWKFFADFLNPLLKTDADKDIYKKRQTKLSFWLQRMNLGKALTPVRHFDKKGDLPKIIELVLYESNPENKNGGRNIKDVGYGASQIIPIIVAALTSDDNSLILIEQPELHLHPAAQADIADLLIDSINGTSRRVLVETHSETMFLRFRVEIARTGATKPTNFPFDPNDFACYYIERFHNENISEAGVMLFDNKGEFSERPEGFFDFFGQDFKETMELRKARS